MCYCTFLAYLSSDLPHFKGSVATRGLMGCTLFIAVNGLYSSSDDVIELTPSNFNREVIQSDSLWLVEFYAPWNSGFVGPKNLHFAKPYNWDHTCGHCQRLTPEWKKVATALKDVVKVGAVDADKHQSLGGQYGVQGFPTIKIFGSNKNQPEDYQGGRTGEAIVDAALSALRQLVKDRLGGRSGGYSSGKQGRSDSSSKKDVIELTDDTFDKSVLDSEDVWMVEFYAPWCGHCKNLEPEWAAAATEVKEQTKGKVKLAAVDATVNQVLASRYEILNEDIAKRTCEEHQLCVVAVLPHILDTEDGTCTERVTGEETPSSWPGWGLAESWRVHLLGGERHQRAYLKNHTPATFCVAIGKPRTNTISAYTQLPVEDDIDLSDVELDDLEKDEL
ncbi:Protein disulfide-isomerase A6, partial [Eschrichtius robustus]|nr:Protein disulfide-isomerase A6 [Eschrichtius robustus]